MKNIKNDVKGITLLTLIITIVELLILASIATYSGVEVIKSSRLTTFTTEMKIMQTQVNELYEKYKNDDNEILLGKSLDEVQTQADIVFSLGASGITEQSGYRYFDQETIQDLNIEGIKGEFFINLEKRSVVSYQGFEYDDETYYTLEQLPNGLYNVAYDDKNTGTPTFDTSVEEISENKWKISISNIQYNDGYIDKWNVKYKLTNQESWNISEDLNFIVNEKGVYNIIIANGNVQSEEKKILVWENDYIREGLLLYYDGINNTRLGNNSNTTFWEDLSGNNNDGELIEMNTDTGYYSSEENGYVFLHNKSYIKSTNKIGISGDANFTIEVVTNLWEEGKNPNYSPYSASNNPAWWGSSSATVGKSCVFGYGRSNKKMSVGFINNSAYSDEDIELIGKTSYMSFRKTKVGQIKNGDTDIGKINYNGQDIPNKYTGSATFTTNIEDSQLQVGRGWQYNNQNRTIYGSVQAVRIYNRVLTDEEIQHNYEIDKVRFNIEENE